MTDKTDSRVMAESSVTPSADDFLNRQDRAAGPLSGKPPGEASGLSLLREEARRGDTSSQFYLGLRLFLEVEGPEREEGLSWFAKAADSDLEEAQFCLALIHREGDPELRDESKSRKLIEKAAAKGLREDPESCGGFAWDTNTDILRGQELGYAVQRLRLANRRYAH